MAIGKGSIPWRLCAAALLATTLAAAPAADGAVHAAHGAGPGACCGPDCACERTAGACSCACPIDGREPSAGAGNRPDHERDATLEAAPCSAPAPRAVPQPAPVKLSLPNGPATGLIFPAAPRHALTPDPPRALFSHPPDPPPPRR